jgi:hypothetical protein
MARNHTISPDFWTMEAVIDCQPMTRLLFIGLWNFADDGGVQPLRPRTIRMQVFPGDTIENDSIRAMIEELAAHGLVGIYAVDGVEYVAIVDWDQMQRVGKRARRRYPALACGVPGAGAAADETARTTANHSNGQTTQSPPSGLRSPSPSGPSEASTLRGEREEWAAAIDARLRAVWPDGRSIESMEPAETERWIGQWIADGCDLERDVLAAVNAEPTPPAGLHALAVAVNVNRCNRLAARAAA